MCKLGFVLSVYSFVRVPVRVCVFWYALRIVSTEKILHFMNNYHIIIINVVVALVH